MRTIVIFVFAGLLIGSILGQCMIFAFCGAGVGLAFGASLAVALADVVPLREVARGPVVLVAMRRSDGTAGTFLLGSGTISSRSSYNFLKLLDNGSMVPCSVPVNNLVRLIEDPQLENVGYWSTVFAEADPTSKFFKWAINTGERTHIVRQEFRVPKGTVIHQFTI